MSVRVNEVVLNTALASGGPWPVTLSLSASVPREPPASHASLGLGVAAATAPWQCAWRLLAGAEATQLQLDVLGCAAGVVSCDAWRDACHWVALKLTPFATARARAADALSQAFCQGSNWSAALEGLAAPALVPLSCAAQACGARSKWRAAAAVMRGAAADRLALDAIARNVAITALASGGPRWRQCLRLLWLPVEGPSSTRARQDTIAHSALLHACSGSAWRFACDVLQGMPRRKLQVSHTACSAGITACQGQWQVMSRLTARLEQRRLAPSLALHNTLAADASDAGSWRRGMAAAERMEHLALVKDCVSFNGLLAHGPWLVDLQLYRTLQQLKLEPTEVTHGAVASFKFKWERALVHMRCMLLTAVQIGAVTAGAALKTCKEAWQLCCSLLRFAPEDGICSSFAISSCELKEVPARRTQRERLALACHLAQKEGISSGGEEPDCSRGYEAWLLKEAKARNPEIRTYALAWGVPGWIGNGTFFSEDNIFYHVAWLKCIKERFKIDIDYMGIWNESPWGDSWYIFDLAAAIKAAQLQTQLVLLDSAPGQPPTEEFMALFSRDERFQQLVAAVGLHYPCTPNEQLLDTLRPHPGTRFWSSEELSTVADWGGAGCWGRMINQNYVRMNATSSIAWSLIWSVYPNLECFGNGLLYAFEPWSGHYEVMAPVWATAHTTQFTKLGWSYLPPGEAAGLLPEGGTFVTIASSDLQDFTIVLETLQGRCMYGNGCFHTVEAKREQMLQLQLSSNLSAAARGKELEVWSTNATHWFQRLDNVQVDEQGRLRISVGVDALVTITTLQGATKQGRRGAGEVHRSQAPEIPAPAAFPLPFKEVFESQPLRRSPAFFSDQGGAFEVVEDDGFQADLRRNRVLEQQVLEVPIGWGRSAPEPLTLFGGTNWTDLEVEVSARFEGTGSANGFAPLAPFGHAEGVSLLATPSKAYVGLCARVLRYTFFNTGGKPEGYCLQVTKGPGLLWGLYVASELVAAGPLGLESEEKLASKGWLRLRLEVLKARISAFVDGVRLASIVDTSLPVGQVALSCGYHKCQFDDIQVLPRGGPMPTHPVTAFMLTTRPLLNFYRPVTFNYDARSCDPTPAPVRKRGDFTGFAGLTFVPKLPLAVAALGRLALRGGQPLGAVHNVQLMRLDKEGLHHIASAAVPSVPTEQVGIISTDEGYQYAELKEKITLTPGEKYVLASSEISGGDFFYDKAHAQPGLGVEILGPDF
ncbi:unnamed protein product [Effrenium voratum]|nr:unnamed protein product [Effrenium voratum]